MMQFLEKSVASVLVLLARHLDNQLLAAKAREVRNIECRIVPRCTLYMCLLFFALPPDSPAVLTVCPSF